MKKLLSVICLSLVCIFCFAGCSAQKNVTKLLDTQEAFKTEQANNLDLTKKIFSDNLKTDYDANKSEEQKLDLRKLEKLVKTSDLTITKLKVYLENEDVVKKLKNGDVKDLIKLQDAYINNFNDLITYNKSLENVISNGGTNLKTDYVKLNDKIKSVLTSSAEFSKKLTDMLKVVYNINITQSQTVLNIGELEILTLEGASNLVYFYSKIYIEETSLASFGALSPDMNIDKVLEKLTNISSATFKITNAQFAEIKDKILIMQDLNNVLLSKSEIFTKVIEQFSYETLKENARTAYPNEDDITNCVLSFVESDKIDITTQSNYNFVAGLTANTIAPAINNILSICNYLEAL